MGVQWTKEQQEVIRLRDRNILVSAAAGSGKTAVLVERILSKITDKEQPVDIDRLLIMTFTRAAAGEMKERISAAIEKALCEDPDNEHLQRQTTLLHTAQITTIDGFCAYIIRNYFHLIGLDPGYRTADEGELKLLRGDVVKALLEEYYAKKDEKFQKFVECFATGKSDENLGNLIQKLYEMAMSNPFPQEWLSGCMDDYRIDSLEELRETEWMRMLWDAVKDELQEAKLLVQEARRINGITATAAAGHSLGEYAAMVYTGMVSRTDGFKLIKARRLAMQKAASESGRIYGMIFHQRLYPKYIRIKQIIDNGELGDIKRVCLINSRYLRTSYYHKSGSWRSSFAGEGGGALINQGQHILDMYQYLFGMPQKLFAAIPFGKYNDFIVDDEATIVMEYDNGKTGTFILSTGEACHEERLEIIGTKARILLEDDTLTITKHRDVCEYIKNEEVNSRQNMTFAEETIQFEKASEPYAQLFENFANAVLKGDESYLTVKGSEGINSLMLCASAYYSACKGIKVELPLEASDYKELMDELIKKEEGE